MWSVGRIADYWLEGGEIWYDIRFPNKIDRRVAEIDLRVRCFLPVDDPASILAAGGMESQYLHDRRRAALECLASARASTYGLTGLLSASVSLMPHQVQVVGRVLNDSVQRYLLADEVGLGKTIEACAVIKQAVLDNPEENVLILAPPSLTGQWRIEQRIGRLDRLGRELIQMNDIYHWIVAPYADYFHPWQAWFELLRDGFQVFHRSVSEVQFLLDDLQGQVKLALYHREAVGIRDMERQVSEAIVQERQRLGEQYALDSRSINYGDTADVFDSIKIFDGASHYKPIDNWITQVLRLGRETMSDNLGDGAFLLHWSPYTLESLYPASKTTLERPPPFRILGPTNDLRARGSG